MLHGSLRQLLHVSAIFPRASLSLLLQALKPVQQSPLHGSLRLLAVHNSLCLWVQVYKGVLRSNGTTVAVKVQRPGIGDGIAIDMLLLRRLMGVVDRNQKVVRGSASWWLGGVCWDYRVRCLTTEAVSKGCLAQA